MSRPLRPGEGAEGDRRSSAVTRVRFHGRGGQGMKTASRIVGTAALLDGFVAQDSPVYGAERRGAPMAAFTRISRTAIFERGVIPVPHLVVIADDTLLEDEAARPLSGLGRGILLIASAHRVDEIAARTGHEGPLIARDFLAIALEEVRNPAAVSSALAAAACVILGLSGAATSEAVRAELAAIGLPRPAIDANLRLAERAAAGLAPLALDLREPPAATRAVRLAEVRYVAPEVGTPNITASANTRLRRTGNWRVFRPVIALEHCTRCWICFVRCPDGAITLDADDTPHVDEEICKGCLICVEECPRHAIAKVREVREWSTTEARS